LDSWNALAASLQQSSNPTLHPSYELLFGSRRLESMELAPKNLPKSDFMLSTETYNEITDVLKELERSTRADLAIFCESNGVTVTYVGNPDQLNLAGFSSLNAANYAATREMAKMLGEKSAFKFLFLEGENNNIYICDIGFEFLLSITFSKTVALGMVRIYANRAVKKLKNILEKAKQSEDRITDQVLDDEFSTLLDKALDSTFNL
jgi:predicted regulator of Ras-like GTPase activity (Roadblock/LC7/MglB family)